MSEPVRIERCCKRVVDTIVTALVDKYIEPIDIPLIRYNANANADKGRKVEKLERSNPAIIIGNGKWVTLPEGDIIVAGVEAAKRVTALGIIPKYLVVTAPDAWSLPLAMNYLVATQCSPKLFKKYDPLAFSLAEGMPVGLAALQLAACLGYTDLHLVGFDCSVDHGPLKITIEGHEFFSTPKLCRQSKEIWAVLAQQFMNVGYSITVHGDGLLATTIREIYREADSPPEQASYPLNVCSSSYDFLTWLANARLHAKGILHVRFIGDLNSRPDVHTGEQRWEMFNNVVRPSLALFDAVEDENIRPDRMYPTSYLPISEAARAGKEVWRIKLGVPRRDNLIVITLREANYITARNSNLEAWKQFARNRMDEGYEVLFIRDTAKADESLDGFATDPEASIDLHARARRYEQAFCNLSVTTGPVSLLLFSDNPFLVFSPINHVDNYQPADAKWWRHAAGIEPGEQMPWFRPNQEFVWEKDNLHNIESSWACWKTKTAFDAMLADPVAA